MSTPKKRSIYLKKGKTQRFRRGGRAVGDGTTGGKVQTTMIDALRQAECLEKGNHLMPKRKGVRYST